jgi:hypothetical protein
VTIPDLRLGAQRIAHLAYASGWSSPARCDRPVGRRVARPEELRRACRSGNDFTPAHALQNLTIHFYFCVVAAALGYFPRGPTRRTVVRMAEALGVSPDALWPGFGGVSVRLLITLLPNCSWSSGSALGHQGWSPGSRAWSMFDQFVCKFLCITCTPPPWAGLGFAWRGSLTRNGRERHALTINGHH